MKHFALILFAAIAFGQDPAPSRIVIMPRSADSDTGSIRVRELGTNGSNVIDIRAPQSIYANKVLRWPAEDSTITARENHVYGTSEHFTFGGFRARGTEGTPVDVNDGDVLMEIYSSARTGGSFATAGKLFFTAEDASPLTGRATIGLTDEGTPADIYEFRPGSFTAAGLPSLGLSSTRWGDVFASTGEFYTPGTGGGYIKSQEYNFVDMGGAGGSHWTVQANATALVSNWTLFDNDATEVVRFHRLVSGLADNTAEFFVDVVPDLDSTKILGADNKRWNVAYANDFDAFTGFVFNDGAHTARINTPTTIPSDYYVYWPGSQGAGALTNDGAGNLTWSSVGSGSRPLEEISIMDYGADNTCTTPITGTDGPWEQARDAALAAGGAPITFPAGCYAIDATLTIGNGNVTGSGEEKALHLIGAGVATRHPYNPTHQWTPATIIRWTGADPGTPTAMVKFLGPLYGGGIKHINLDAADVPNVIPLWQDHHGEGEFSYVTMSRYRGFAHKLAVSEVGYTWGACHSNYYMMKAIDPGIGGSGLDVGSDASGSGTPCSNTWTGGEYWRDVTTTGTFGLRLGCSDNNEWNRVSFLSLTKHNSISDMPVDVATTGDIHFTSCAEAPTSPTDNLFLFVATHKGVSGVSGTRGNRFIDFIDGECGGTPCVPAIDNIIGTSSGYSFGTPATPPGAKWIHEHGDDTWVVWQASSDNSAGAIGFKRIDDPTQFRIAAHALDGLTIWTAANLSNAEERWRFTTAGHLNPVTDGAVNLGNTTFKPGEIWSRKFRTYTNAAFGTQDHTWSADANMNLYMQTYSGTTADDRPALQFMRARGSSAGASSVLANDRLGVIAWIPYASSGFGTAGAVIEAHALSVSGTSVASQLNFRVQNSSGTLADRFNLSSVSADFSVPINATGSPAYRVAGTTVIDASRNGSFVDLTVTGTCTGCGGGITGWSVDGSGNMLPNVDGTPSIGNTTFKPFEVWARRFRTYTNSAYGTQDHTWVADANMNLYLQTWSGGTASDRAGLHMMRGRGSSSFPSTVFAGDRLGAIVWWPYTSFGFSSAGAVIEAYATSVSGTAIGTELRFRTQNSAGSLADRMTITSSGDTTIGGGLTINGVINSTGSPAYRVSGATVIDASRNGTFASVNPTSDASGALGSSLLRWSALHLVGGNNLDCSGQCAPVSDITDNLGSASNRFATTYTYNLVLYGGVTAPSGSPGATATIGCGTGQAVKSITISAGIVTAVSCGTP